MISRTPEVTCVVVDVAQGAPVTFTWYVDGKEVNTGKMTSEEEQFNSTLRVVGSLPILHQDWLQGKEFKCKVSNKDMPSPVLRSISKAKGGAHSGEAGARGAGPCLGVTVGADPVPQGRSRSRSCTSWPRTRTS